MIKLGEVKYGREIGKASKSNKFIWHACIDCGKKRWVVLNKEFPVSQVCKGCKNENFIKWGEDHPRWKGGRHLLFGYVMVLLSPDNFFYSMASKGYIKEHRLIMAKHLGRCLLKTEHIHHKNGVRGDNRIENLELTTNGAHAIAHNKGYEDGYAQGLIDGLNRAKEMV